ncbi:PLD nuclease N-terminal domain-containing protein [Actinoplanes utahensis]|uniref:Cardiolipin synthase N-terminal domain-containing protein n=1 Tax=Actinoplanes utahensis TaxID=1869 RepID=A0A0A6UJN5_ACTUT|nr:PLD nuclease N-terminal domain-containing protein [Actinoplanes utahensis]KHD74534.1 hypothetical protein MB27_28385 [Actinoplanes utahensis]GIF28786.1 membrane protein [Actinoplanes utahensis]
MARVNTLIFLAVIAFSVVALLDCLRTEQSRLQSFPRRAWAVLILLCPVFGAIAWFRAGRGPARRPAPADHPVAAGGAVAAGVFVGPEDDPDFVRQMAAALRDR